MRAILLVVLLGCAAAVAAGLRLGWFLSGSSAADEVRVVTFNKHIAPIVFHRCAPCHRPEGSGPFSLLDYASVKRRAAQIADLTARRIMPPWPAAPECGQFADNPSLTQQELTLIRRWTDEGQAQGDAADLPSPPPPPSQWSLGNPDLVVGMPAAYTLAAEGEGGRDVYRNFVMPMPPATGPRYVRAVEVHPGNLRSVHHLSVMVDETGQARRRAARQTEAGYPGMEVGDGPRMPAGHLLAWVPGRGPLVEPEGLAWELAAAADLVLQMHLRPSGKPEPIQAEVGFYFTSQPPTRRPISIMLRSTAIDIPAGDASYAFDASYTLPVDVDALVVQPHAHYLGKDLHAWAELPDGTEKCLIHIKDWDFNWQQSYRLASPLFLPSGTVLRMHYTYDNSSANVRNPNHPPKRVTYGVQTSDEMGEFWVQVAPRRNFNAEYLLEDYSRKVAIPDFQQRVQNMVRFHPDDLDARVNQAAVLARQGSFDIALEQVRKVLAESPNDQRAHAVAAGILVRRGEAAAAQAEYEAAVRLDPNDDQSQNDLGYLLLLGGKVDDAIAHLEAAVRLNPRDALTHTNLGRAYVRAARTADAEKQFQAALDLNPKDATAAEELSKLRAGR